MSLLAVSRKRDGTSSADTYIRRVPVLQSRGGQRLRARAPGRAAPIRQALVPLARHPGLPGRVHPLHDAQFWSAISGAIAGARYFVLLASPDAAQSHWVAREVAFWCAERGSSNLLIVLTGGELVWDEAARDFDWSRTNTLPPRVARCVPGRAAVPGLPRPGARPERLSCAIRPSATRSPTSPPRCTAVRRTNSSVRTSDSTPSPNTGSARPSPHWSCSCWSPSPWRSSPCCSATRRGNRRVAATAPARGRGRRGGPDRPFVAAGTRLRGTQAQPGRPGRARRGDGPGHPSGPRPSGPRAGGLHLLQPRRSAAGRNGTGRQPDRVGSAGHRTPSARRGADGSGTPAMPGVQPESGTRSPSVATTVASASGI